MRRALLNLAAVAAVLVWLAAGIWFWGAVVAPGYFTAIGAIAAWFLVTGFVTTRLGRRFPDVRPGLRGTYFAAALAVLVAGYLTSVRETTVNEPLVTGVPASELPATGSDAALAPQEDEPRRRSVDELLAPQEQP